jgi:hypothetical protein
VGGIKAGGIDVGGIKSGGIKQASFQLIFTLYFNICLEPFLKYISV